MRAMLVGLGDVGLNRDLWQVIRRHRRVGFPWPADIHCAITVIQPLAADSQRGTRRGESRYLDGPACVKARTDMA
jgi:hypothetical protein